ncbi:uncharacterized protein LOC135813673 [Sycon ciliatum]|uniref:uncharacterized protein LOC135813673 n=1 Tax=Sycon ciliatum TaxID=27933 RepID=UPI0031F71177
MDSSGNFVISIFITALLVGIAVYPIAGAALPKDLSPLAWLQYHDQRISDAAHRRIQRMVDLDGRSVPEDNDSRGPDGGPNVGPIESATEAVAVIDVLGSTAVDPDNSSTPEDDSNSTASVIELTKSRTEAVTDRPGSLAAIWRGRFPIKSFFQRGELAKYYELAIQLDLTNIKQWVAQRCVTTLTLINPACSQPCIDDLEHPDCWLCKMWCTPKRQTIVDYHWRERPTPAPPRQENSTEPYYDEWELFMLMMSFPWV